MMMVDFGQYTYKSATMLQATCAIIIGLLATTMFAILCRVPDEQNELLPETREACKHPEDGERL